MAINQIRKYIWLLDTLRQKGKLTFKELNELWLDDEISEGVELSIRTFHKWRIAIEDLFAINIENEGKGEYRYYISTPLGIDKNPLCNWIVGTFSLGNLMMNSLSLHERIILEPSPSSSFLPILLAAMKEGHAIQIKYKAFGWKSDKNILIEPYCIKQFKQRWYILGRHMQMDKLFIYAFDRIVNIEKVDVRFTLPNSFAATDCFTHAYGIIIEDGTPLETVVLKVSEGHAPYLRSLPLHHSQVEKDLAEGYSIFEYSLCPTFDFQQTLLSFGAEVEVLSPQWLREQISAKVKSMYEKYNQ